MSVQHTRIADNGNKKRYPVEMEVVPPTCYVSLPARTRNFPVLAEKCLSARGADRCKKYYLEISRLKFRRAIGSSPACDVFAGFLDQVPVAIKKLRPHIIRSNLTPELDDLVNEINFMSRSVVPLRSVS